METENNNLFIGKTKIEENDIQQQIDGSTGDKGFKQKVKDFSKNVADQASGIGKDVLEQTKTFGKGVIDTLKDATQSIKVRQGLEDKAELQIESVDFANRHTDAITGILNKTFSGNLFDAGVSALNLFNQGTKIDVSKTPHIDRNSYRFKYLYSKDGNNDDNINNTKEGENVIYFLDSIEDPTILGFSLKIDKESSPLFSGIKQVSDNTSTPTTPVERNSAYNFIELYKKEYSEMEYCLDYLKEFTDSISKIFSSPSTDTSFLTAKLKNHYVQSIKNINKLDDRFVNTTDNNEDFLEFELSEDVRLYTTRMVMLYKNLTWSYNMGKKLIPENLLRFNLYIKISEKRNFTSSANQDSDTYKNIRDGYSRIIYELKDCEFLFNESSILGSDMNMSSVSDEFAKLTIKIKYRKVNRFFYSKYFGGENIIGDKYFKPDINKTKTDLISSKFIPDTDVKSKAVSNNIPVAESLTSKLNKLKTNGLLKNTDKDNAVSRFGKSIGNKAIKTGATLLDDKVQQIKNDLNQSTSFINNNITGFLKGNLFTKTKELGTIKVDVNEDSYNINTDPSRDTTNPIKIIDINSEPSRDETTNTNQHQTIVNKNDIVNEKTHKYHNVNDPSGYIDMIVKPIPIMKEENLDSGNKIVPDMIDENLNIGNKSTIKDPKSIIPISDKPIVIEEEYLDSGDKPIIKNPDITIPNTTLNISDPNETVYKNTTHNIIMNDLNVNNGDTNSIKNPIQTEMFHTDNTIKEPISDITKIKHDIEEPNSLPLISKNVIEEPIQITSNTLNVPILEPVDSDMENILTKIKSPDSDLFTTIKSVDTIQNLGTIDIKNINLDKQDNLGNIEDFKKKWVIKTPPNNPNLKC